MSVDDENSDEPAGFHWYEYGGVPNETTAVAVKDSPSANGEDAPPIPLIKIEHDSSAGH
jgi:hypothetical protein